MAKDNYTVGLGKKDIPKKWYNILPDLPKSTSPPLHPETKEPVTEEDIDWLFAKELIKIELGKGKYSKKDKIEIPSKVRDIYELYRPTPLFRATTLEKHLDTPARIYIKREDVSPAGSHKPNTSLAQVYYNKKDGVRRVLTDTGAGQWGTALAFSCMKFGLECLVFMVKVSYDQKPYRRILMNLYGAQVIASPSNTTEYGRKMLDINPNHPGSLGIGMSEALEVVKADDDTKMALGCMSYYASMHQTVIGLETLKQLKKLDVVPDKMIGCVGGGSNFLGFTMPFIKDSLKGRIDTEYISAEPTSVPTLTQGEFRYDYSDSGQLMPMIEMFTLGHEFVPPSIHAGGLRYHGKTPVLSSLVKEGVVQPQAFEQDDVFEAAQLFAKTEGILPAPESGHAIQAAVAEAKRCKREKKKENIVVILSGHGMLDLRGYEEYMKRSSH